MRYITQLTGDEMRRIRRRAEMTVREFAAELGMTPHSIGHFEMGHRRIRRTVAMAVRYFEAHYLGGPES